MVGACSHSCFFSSSQKSSSLRERAASAVGVPGSMMNDSACAYSADGPNKYEYRTARRMSTASAPKRTFRILRLCCLKNAGKELSAPMRNMVALGKRLDSSTPSAFNIEAVYGPIK